MGECGLIRKIFRNWNWSDLVIGIKCVRGSEMAERVRGFKVCYLCGVLL